MTSTDTLALRGGTPIRTASFPTVDTPSGRRLGAEELHNLEEVIRSGALNRVGGTQVPHLEAEFAEYIGSTHAVASTSGTSAVHLAVAAVDPEPGDEIVVPPITDFGTIIGVLAQNAVPVFADVDPQTGCITAESVAAVITDRTRAVIVVHLFGGAAPIEAIKAVCAPKGITVIEDCAQAYLTVPEGATSFAGTRGNIGCFSLQQSKHITAGDGGLSVTDDDACARRMRLFADKGWPRETGERANLFLGLNYRMTELQGAVARAQLGKLAGVVADRRAAARIITAAAGELAGVNLPPDPDRHSYWQLPLVLDPAVVGVDNKAFAEALRAEGIPAAAGYLPTPVYLSPALTQRRTYGSSGYPFTSPPARTEIRYARGDCPNAERLLDETLLIVPINENYTESDAADIAAGIAKVHALAGDSSRAAS